MQTLNCRLHATQQSRDGGIDHQVQLAHPRGAWTLPDLEVEVVTQCKNESKPVGVRYVREFHGVLSFFPANAVGLFASASGYSLYAQRFFLRMEHPAILCTVDVPTARIASFLLNDRAQTLLPKLTVGSLFVGQEHALNLSDMAAPLDLASLQSMAQLIRGSYLTQVLLLLLVALFLRYVAASWRWKGAALGDLKPEGKMCPPINPNVRYRYGVSQMQGRRPYMEDRHTAMADLNGDPTQSFYGIFDGHGGDGAAK
ncbi:hypothetical protein BBJ28_00018239 [Nothophytophthora sp. Chile5]|nr:hypothetical protein BBJ28_00018239 [Nothophytophthora sp. Chile5]